MKQPGQNSEGSEAGKEDRLLEAVDMATMRLDKARTCMHVRPLQVPRTTPRSMLMIMVSLAGMMKSKLFHVRLTYGQRHAMWYYGLQCQVQSREARPRCEKDSLRLGWLGCTRDREEDQGAHKDQTGDMLSATAPLGHCAPLVVLVLVPDLQ